MLIQAMASRDRIVSPHLLSAAFSVARAPLSLAPASWHRRARSVVQWGGTWHPPPAAGCPLGPQGRSQVFLAGAWERACDSSADRGDLTPLSFHRKLERFYIKLWNAPPGQGLAENPETPPQVKRLRGQRLALTRQKGVQASGGGPQPVGWGLGRPAFAPAAMSRSFIQVCAENTGVPPSQREDVPAVALLGRGRGRGVASGPLSLVPPCVLLK